VVFEGTQRRVDFIKLAHFPSDFAQKGENGQRPGSDPGNAERWHKIKDCQEEMGKSYRMNTDQLNRDEQALDERKSDLCMPLAKCGREV
jgi:hypothetical protein